LNGKTFKISLSKNEEVISFHMWIYPGVNFWGRGKGVDLACTKFYKALDKTSNHFVVLIPSLT